jgi:hypothetical protein
MRVYDHYDITNASFEDFVAFLFDHDVVPVANESAQKQDPWYWRAKVKFNADHVVEFYTRLFTEPAFLRSKFDRDHLEQGFWAIPSCTLDCSVYNMIWYQGVPFENRANCVLSMYHLYERLFSFDSLETSVYMWWVKLAYGWHCKNRSRANGGEDETMQDVMFETLGRILMLPSESCKVAALDGLGHLHHPVTTQLVDEFLAVTPDVKAELKEYALAAARFEVQ